MSNGGDNKSECLRYPGQPDTHTRDELIEYFEKLAAKESRTKRAKAAGIKLAELELAEGDIKSVIRARDHLAAMYKDSERRLKAALEPTPTPEPEPHICRGLIGKPCDICGAPEPELQTKITKSGFYKGGMLYSYGGEIWFSTQEAAANARPGPVSSR